MREDSAGIAPGTLAGSAVPTGADSQSANSVLMIRPCAFGPNRQTASSNAFQQLRPLKTSETVEAARREFDAVAAALDDAGVNVCVYDDLPQLQAPDAVFPNNWVSFHADGTVVLYPLLTPNRRIERRADIVASLASTHGFQVARILDLSSYEQQGQYLEGTGSMVLDRIQRIAYACLSPRTQSEMLARFAKQLGYRPVTFNATDAQRVPVYHTNVLMSLGTRFAVLCSEALSAADSLEVRAQLEATHVVVEISQEQMAAFAGNILELVNRHTQKVLAMSESAYRSLSPQQRRMLEGSVDDICTVPIPTIEQVGGGSVRCMLAEIHLRKLHA